MFYINKETELNEALIQKILNKFIMTELPKLQKWENYYRGKHDINFKHYVDDNKPCSHIVTNFCKVIADTYSGYICGKPISYYSNDDIDDIQDIINYNDSAAEDIQWLNNSLVYGVAYELQWLDEMSQIRYSQVNPLQAFAIFDNSLDSELLYFVRWFKADCFSDNDLHYLELYTDKEVRTYELNGLGGALKLVETKPHYFNDVPVSVFYLNRQEENIFNCIMSLNDAYNELQSSEVDDFSAWVDAYLVLAGMDADASEIASMKENRVLIIPEGGEANWLVKNSSDTQIENMLNNIRRNIFKITACPDMADETFLAQSGTALAYKLVGFENAASSIVANFTKAIQRRIELICNILNLKASDATWRDIQIKFVRNIPVNLQETLQIVNSLRGIVSDATLLSQIPFISDVNTELEAIDKQNSLYSFDKGEMNDTKEENQE